jgi:hypothetical protein
MLEIFSVKQGEGGERNRRTRQMKVKWLKDAKLQVLEDV